jgi:hypothetical protein
MPGHHPTPGGVGRLRQGCSTRSRAPQRIRTADLLGAIQTLGCVQTGVAAADPAERLEPRNIARNAVHRSLKEPPPVWWIAGLTRPLHVAVDRAVIPTPPRTGVGLRASQELFDRGEERRDVVGQ